MKPEEDFIKADFIIVTCPNCSEKNRVNRGLLLRAICGNCRRPLLKPDDVIVLMVGLLEGFKQTHLPELMKRMGHGGLLGKVSHKAKEAEVEIMLAAYWAVLEAVIVFSPDDQSAIFELFVKTMDEVAGVQARAVLARRLHEYSDILHSKRIEPGEIAFQLGKAVANHAGVDATDLKSITSIAINLTIMIETAREALTELRDGKL